MGLLPLAGVLSGAGEAARSSLQLMQTGQIQKMLLDERAKYDTLRDERLEGFASKREQRQYTHAETLQKQGFEHAESLQAVTLNAQQAEHEIDRGVQRSIAAMTNERMKEEGSADRANRVELAKMNKAVAMQQLEDGRNKVQLVTDAQGQVMRVDATGNNLGYLDVVDAKGQPIKGADGQPVHVIAGKDLDAKTKAQIEIMKTMITKYGDVAERLAATEPEQSRDYLAKAERMQKNVDVLLGKGTPDPAVPVPIKDRFAPAPKTAKSAPEPEQPVSTDRTPSQDAALKAYHNAKASGNADHIRIAEAELKRVMQSDPLTTPGMINFVSR